MTIDHAKLIAQSLKMFSIVNRLVQADWIGATELNQWRKEGREIIQQVESDEKDYGTNAGVRCDVDKGPCACGAWH